MASIPPRAAPQRRSSPRPSHEQSSAELPRADSEAFSTTSEDSQTLLLNRRPSASPKEEASELTQVSSQATVPSPPPQPEEDEEPRKCWICFNDETEDTPMSTEWRSPCKCALTAHEGCLLDWIADMEAPSSRRRTGGTSKEILCPQCKSQIHIARPRSFVVDGVRVIEKLTGMLILPGVVSVLGFTFYQACQMHGISTIYLVFGNTDAQRILEPLTRAAADTDSVFLSSLNNLYNNWRLTSGLFLIPSLLIASRTTLADSVLPILPMVFFASYDRTDKVLSLDSWPPSAALSFGLLPYVRSAYNFYYDRVWRKHERRWLREIQPRANDPDNNGQGDEQAAINDEEDIDIRGGEDDGFWFGQGILDVNIDLEVEDFDFDHDHEHVHGLPAVADDNAHEHPQHDQAPPLDAPPLPDDAQHHNPAPAAAAPREPPIAGHAQLSVSKLADTVLGALVFPSVAAMMGEVLRVALPRSWSTLPASGKAGGLLQARWGRSLVGGCLFVTVRDALMLYVRWKMAQNHRQRRILDWDKVRKEVRDPRKTGRGRS